MLEEKGFKLFLDSLDDIESFMLKLNHKENPDSRIIIFAVNKNRSGDRQWFSLAHELGHYFLKFSQGFTPQQQEKIINRFAGAFLAPRQRVEVELGPKRTHILLSELHALKHAYHLSMQGWIHRAEELGIISKSYTNRLRKVFKEKGWDKKEPGMQVPTITHSRFTQLVLRALSESLISMSKAKELLGKPIETLELNFVKS